jgi:phosphoribosylformylglycinamidine (FGAM) synthase-like enzyme
MKKFNFKINNFYSIFNQMPENNKNIESFLDEKFRNSLKDNTSDDFTLELMKRVALQNEFVKEDKKTDKVVKFAIGGFIAVLAFITFAIGMSLKTGNAKNETSYFNEVIERISGVIENISVLTMENLGFTFNLQSALILLVVMVCVFIYSFADRTLLKKN